MICACYTRDKRIVGRCWSLTKSKILAEKNNLETKRAGDTAQIVEHLPRKQEALSSNPTTTQKKKN
jgi:hypothetical protein